MSSSASRLRCTMMILAWAANSKIKSRSLTASRLFLKTRGKPSSAATDCRVDGKGGAGQGRSPQGRDLDAVQGFLQALAVPPPHLVIGQEVVGEQYRLGPLQVGVAGHDDVPVPVRQTHPGQAQVGEIMDEALHLLRQIEAHVQGHLVVPAPGGVELLAHLAEPGGEPGLDGHVDVFQGRVELELFGLDLPADFRKPRHDLVPFRHGDDALPGQHAGVGHGAGDILAGQAPVKAQGGGEILHRLVGFAFETSAPGFLRHTTFLKLCVRNKICRL